MLVSLSSFTKFPSVSLINSLKTFNFSVGAATQLAVSTTLIDITPSAAVFNPYDRKCWDQDQNEIALDHFFYEDDFR